MSVGSRIIIYTNNIHQRLNRKTPVTTACHFQKRHSGQGQSASSLEAAQGLARGKQHYLEFLVVQQNVNRIFQETIHFTVSC